MVVVAVIAAAGVWYVRRARAHEQAVRVALVHRQKGMELFNARAFADAQRMLDLAVRADPGDWEATYFAGLAEIELKQFDRAVPYLEKALTLQPREVKIITALGVCYFKMGRLDMARGYFWAAFAADPGNADARGLVETMAKLQWRAESTGVAATGSAPKH